MLSFNFKELIDTSELLHEKAIATNEKLDEKLV